jgi:hypothetical protein
MTPFWIEFVGRSSACVEATDERSALALAKELTGNETRGAKRLPYPAEPRLNQHIIESIGSPCPSFCYTPGECAGRSCCPKRHACDD